MEFSRGSRQLALWLYLGKMSNIVVIDGIKRKFQRMKAELDERGVSLLGSE